MFREFARPMTRHDFAHDFLLDKTPGMIARRAFIVGEEFFDAVIIECGHVFQVLKESTLLCPAFAINKIDIANCDWAAHARRVRSPEISLESRDTQRWHDFTNI